MTVLNTREHLPIVLNGKHYEVDLASFRRTTVEAMRTQNDLNSEATEQTLNTVYVWKRSGADFRLGAGQYWFDVFEGSSRRRFHESLNVDPWTQHELSLLNTTTLRTSVLTSNPFKDSWFCNIQDYLIYIRNSSSFGLNSGWQSHYVAEPTGSSWTIGASTKIINSGETFTFTEGHTGTEATTTTGWITSLGSNGNAIYLTMSHRTPYTTLNGAVAAGATVVTLTSASPAGLPAIIPGMILVVGTDQMLVTTIVGNVATVQRAYNGSTDTALSNGATVTVDGVHTREAGVFKYAIASTGNLDAGIPPTFKFGRHGTSGKEYSDVLVAGNYVLAKHYDTSADKLVQVLNTTDDEIASYNQGWMPHFTAAIQGPDGIYLSGTDPIELSSSTAGLNSTIYRCSFNTSTASLNAPSPVAALPTGEVINTMYSYAGYILIGTSKGFRLGTFLQTGGISFGPVVGLENYIDASDGITSDGTFTAADSTFRGGVTDFEGKGQYVWFNWNRYVPTSLEDYTGLGRIDLGQLVDDLQPAYATDLMIANTHGAEAEVQAIVNIKDKIYFATNYDGVRGETSTKHTSGWLRSGKINFGTTEPKQFIRIDLEGANYGNPATAEDIAVKFVGDATNIGSLYTNGPVSAIDGVSGEFEELEFVWSGASNANDAILNKWTLRAVPVPERQEEIYLPIIIKDAVTHNYAFSVGADPYTDFAELNALMKARSIIELVIGDETRNVFIDSISTGEQQGVDVERWNKNESWLEGVWHVKCITVDQTVSNTAPVIYVGPPITIGSVTTVDDGSPATVVNSGTTHYPVLDFEIPSGNWSTAQAINAQTGTYLISSTDVGKLITVDDGSPVVLYLNTGLGINVGQRIDIAQLGLGQVSFGGTATIVGTPQPKLRAQYSAATLICIATDTFLLVGDLAVL